MEQKSAACGFIVGDDDRKVIMVGAGRLGSVHDSLFCAETQPCLAALTAYLNSSYDEKSAGKYLF
jgi:hypothetical protein